MVGAMSKTSDGRRVAYDIGVKKRIKGLRVALTMASNPTPDQFVLQEGKGKADIGMDETANGHCYPASSNP